MTTKWYKEYKQEYKLVARNSILLRRLRVDYITLSREAQKRLSLDKIL